MEKSPWKKILSVLATIVIILSGFLLYARYIGTSGLIVKEYKITNSSIPESFYGAKIVHISDIHYGRTVKKKELKYMVDKINSLKPDIVVLTGDLIDRNTLLTDKTAKVISDSLSEINATLGKYAITGNHDYKFDKWSTIIADSGFINLNDRYDLIYNDSTKPIFLGGLSTNSYQKDKKLEEKIKIMDDYFNTRTEENKGTFPDYKILLMHEPDFIDNINYENYDLILAGHSHNGQVRIPIIGAVILPPNAKKYYKPYYNINGTDLYISSGIGTSTINYRWFNRPSINLYRLVNY